MTSQENYEWEIKMTNEGKKYYYNKNTKNFV